MNAFDLAGSVLRGWTAHTVDAMRRAPGSARRYVYASAWRPCKRAMCLDLTHPEDSSFDESTFERFYDGLDFEADTRARLIKAGKMADPPFTVEGGQERLEIKDRNGRVIIVGKLDGKLDFGRGLGAFPFEIKGGESVRRVNSVADFDEGVWTRPMLRQLLVYLLGTGCPTGIFVLKRPGGPTFIKVSLEDAEMLDMAEGFMQDATLACDVAAGLAELPDFTTNPANCTRCDHYGKSCAPDVDFGEGLQVVDDDDLVKLARDVCENREAAAKFSKAEKDLKAAFKGRPLVHLGGKFEVTGHWGKSTSYPGIPADVKAPYKVVKEEGSWKGFNVQPIGGEGGGEDG